MDMKKLFFFFAALVVSAALVWTNRAGMTARWLSSRLNVPVSIRSLQIDRTRADLSHLQLGNPSRSKSPTAFSAETIFLRSSLEQLRSDPRVIEEIAIENIFVGIEYYGESDTNWDYILAPEKNGRKSRIGSLQFKNIAIEVTRSDGEIHRYPVIEELVLSDVESEGEIEKTILRLLLEDLLEQMNFQEMLQRFRFQNRPTFNPALSR
jgi:hypothetical protein